MYRWELDDAAQPVSDSLQPETRAALTAFMDAVVIVDPVEYKRKSADTANQSWHLRITCHLCRRSDVRAHANSHNSHDLRRWRRYMGQLARHASLSVG